MKRAVCMGCLLLCLLGLPAGAFGALQVELTAEEVDDLVKKEVERLEKEGFSPQKDRGKTDQ